MIKVVDNLKKSRRRGTINVSCIRGVDTMAFDQNSYTNEYKRNSYDRLSLLVPKGRKADIQLEATVRGLSVNALIINALEECYGLNLSK